MGEQTLVSLVGGSDVVREQMVYPSSVSRKPDGSPLKLVAEVTYDGSRGPAPLAVVMHGYIAGIDAVRQNADRLRERGFFVISVAMRGRDGSEGQRDSGGLEVHDIVDAVHAAVARYGQRIAADRWYITGYSGGGGNTLAVLTRFPDLFTAGSAFFPMTDYGYDVGTGWFYEAGSEPFRNHLLADIGDPRSGDPAVLDRYLARAIRFAAGNNRGAEIHLFVNRDEAICPPGHVLGFVGEAVRTALEPEQYRNLHLHLGSPESYVDFNGNGRFEPEERQYWPHSYLTRDQQAAAEKHFLGRLLAGEIPPPEIPATGEMFVAGWVTTRHFSCWLGDGQNAAGRLRYSVGEAGATFALEWLSQDRTLPGRLQVNTDRWNGQTVEVYRNGQLLVRMAGGGWVEIQSADGDEVQLLPASVRPVLRGPAPLPDGAWAVEVDGPAGARGMAESSPDLASWTPLGRFEWDNAGRAVIPVPPPPSVQAQEFYRVRLETGANLPPAKSGPPPSKGFR